MKIKKVRIDSKYNNNCLAPSWTIELIIGDILSVRGKIVYILFFEKYKIMVKMIFEKNIF